VQVGLWGCAGESRNVDRRPEDSRLVDVDVVTVR
jgi:hypothetical protein